MRSLLLALLVGCGASSSDTSADEGGAGASSAGGVAPLRDPEIDPQICASDADCMIGTPRNCCASFCPRDAVAWSRAAWADYQAECAVEECAVLEDAACLPETPPPMAARCVEERCVLVVGAAALAP